MAGAVILAALVLYTVLDVGALDLFAAAALALCVVLGAAYEVRAWVRAHGGDVLRALMVGFVAAALAFGFVAAALAAEGTPDDPPPPAGHVETGPGTADGP